MKPEQTQPATPGRAVREYLENDVWPLLPPDQIGRVLSREEEDQILGFGPEGY